MISIIYPVPGERELEILKRTIVNLELDWRLGLEIICVVWTESVRKVVRDFLDENVGVRTGKVVMYEGHEPYKQCEALSDESEFVFLSPARIPWACVSRLYEDFKKKPKAGLITGVNIDCGGAFPNEVDNLYSNAPKLVNVRKNSDTDELEEIGTAPLMGIMTKTKTFKELIGLEDLPCCGVYSYGIRLKRQGYQNWQDKNVRYREEVGDADYNA